MKRRSTRVSVARSGRRPSLKKALKLAAPVNIIDSGAVVGPSVPREEARQSAGRQERYPYEATPRSTCICARWDRPNYSPRQEEVGWPGGSRRGDKKAPRADDKATLRLGGEDCRDTRITAMHWLVLSTGHMGLMKAVERFDPARGKLSTTVRGG